MQFDVESPATFADHVDQWSASSWDRVFVKVGPFRQALSWVVDQIVHVHARVGSRAAGR